MWRRQVLHFLCSLSFLMDGVKAVDPRPHIIVIIADDLGWNDVGFHGSGQISTPNIDALAYNGIIFDRHYVQQVCTPSRAALLTGRYPIRLGYQGKPISAGESRRISHEFKTLPGELRKLGYETHLVGKWHLGAGYRNATPLAYGYDTHYGYWNGYIGYFDQRTTRFNGTSGVDFHEGHRPVNVSGRYVTDVITDRALQIIDGHNGGAPLYLSVNHLAPHTGKFLGINNTTLEVHDKEATDRKYHYIGDPTRRMLAEVIEKLDDSIGRIIAKLHSKRLLENSVILFLSDNGAPTYEVHANSGSNFPLRGIKGSLFEGAVRVPAVLYSKKTEQPGRAFRNLFHVTDWVPTLYAAAGGNRDVFKETDGVDQWDNVISNRNLNLRQELLVNIYRDQSAFIGYNGRYKLVNSTNPNLDGFTGDAGTGSYNLTRVLESAAHRAVGNSRSDYLSLREAVTLGDCRRSPSPDPCGLCLFDLAEDPCEVTNVAGLHPDVVRELSRKISRYERESVPPQINEIDPRSDPSNCGGYWFTWLEESDACFTAS